MYLLLQRIELSSAHLGRLLVSNLWDMLRRETLRVYRLTDILADVVILVGEMY